MQPPLTQAFSVPTLALVQRPLSRVCGMRLCAAGGEGCRGLLERPHCHRVTKFCERCRQMVTAASARGRCNGHRSYLLLPGVPLGLHLTEEHLHLLQLLGKLYEQFYPCIGMRDSDPASG